MIYVRHDGIDTLLARATGATAPFEARGVDTADLPSLTIPGLHAGWFTVKVNCLLHDAGVVKGALNVASDDESHRTDSVALTVRGVDASKITPIEGVWNVDERLGQRFVF